MYIWLYMTGGILYKLTSCVGDNLQLNIGVC